MRDLGPRPLVLGAYYLLDVASARIGRGESPRPLLDEVFGAARDLGALAVRTMGAQITAGARGLPAPDGTLGEAALAAMDAIVRAAAAHDVGLVFSLGNHWNDYGGAMSWCAMAGLPEPEDGDGRAYVHPAVRAKRRAFVEALLSREIDGTRVGVHPAIAAWEPLNEPRARGLDYDGRALRAWLDEETETIAALAPGVPIASGEEGLDRSLDGHDAALHTRARTLHLFEHGQSFTKNARSPRVAFPSVHVYPEAWGAPPELRAEVAIAFVRESAAIARHAGKRLFVGELGAPTPGRWELLGPVMRAAWREGAIVGLWMLRAESAPGHHDRHAFDVAEAREALRAIRGA